MKEEYNCVFLSDYLNKKVELNELGVFDCIINSDSNFCINILRLKEANTPEFLGSYQKINDFFGKIMLLLENAKDKNDKDVFYRNAVKMFNFGEVNEINLGVSSTQNGAGFGKILSNRVISDAFEIVKAGSKQPEIFHLISLFEENIAGDRLSDMIASIILEDIRQYTQRINKRLNIDSNNYASFNFKNDIIINPFKNCELLYLPQEILHELPIAKDWSDVDRVITENEAIRNEINELIGIEWNKIASSEKKKYIKKQIFLNPKKCENVIKKYREETIDQYDLKTEIEYGINVAFRDIKESGVLSFLCHNADDFDSIKISSIILQNFKDWVEDCAGWKIIQDFNQSKREKMIQSLILLCGKETCESYDYDFSFETNMGPGPSDIKVSKGTMDKTIIEVKLNSNPDYLHGYQEQLPKYCKAEKTNKGIYVYIIVEEHEIKDKRMRELYNESKKKDSNSPDLFVINARPQLSASKL